MFQRQVEVRHSVANFFLRSKDVHEENGCLYITLFGRLTREYTYFKGDYEYTKTETVWVDIKEFSEEEVTEKLLVMPNRIARFQVSDELFKELHCISKSSPQELFCITPLHTIKKYAY